MSLDPFRNYDCWKLRTPDEESSFGDDDHVEGCRCKECDPDLEREMREDMELFADLCEPYEEDDRDVA